MIHEACGHALEGDIVYKDYSLLKDKIGEEVASSSINLIDDATIKDAFGSYKYDDEGTPSQDHDKLYIEGLSIRCFL